MELNKKVENELTSEQKVKFQRDNGKFKLLKNIFFIPMILAIVGIYLESIPIVSISIVFIIIFLIFKICSFSKKNTVYDNNIIPIVLNEKFEDVKKNNEEELIEEEFRKSNLIRDYDKIKVDKSYILKNEKYDINLSKINIHRLNIEENDGVVDKDLEEIFSGIFAFVKLPSKNIPNFRTIKKNFEDSESSENIVKIANAEFDLNYDIFSLNPVEVRSMLSPGVMARILGFNAKIGRIINFSIYDDILYISIDYKEFLEFKSSGKNYIKESIAQENLEVLEVLDIFIRYFINMYEK